MADEDEEVSCSGTDSFKNLGDCFQQGLDNLREDITSRIGSAIRDTIAGETENALEGLARLITEQVGRTLDVLMSWIVQDSNLDLLSGSHNETITRMDSLSPLLLPDFRTYTERPSLRRVECLMTNTNRSTLRPQPSGSSLTRRTGTTER